MKKPFKHYRLPVLSALGSCLLLLGCTNSDYDFDKVDYTLGFGGDELALPGNNSTKDILLDDLLDISTSDLITTEENGDYKLFKEPDNDIAPVNVNIDRIMISGKDEQGLSFNIGLPTIPPALVGTKIELPYTIPGTSDVIDIPEVGDNISLLEYEFNADQAIKSLEYVEVGENGQGVNLTLNLTVPTAINKFSMMTIDLPDMLTMTCPSMADKFNTQGNVLTLTDYPNSGNMQIVFNVTRINVKTIDNDNYVKLENGKFMLKASVRLSLKISEITIPNVDQLTVSGDAHFADIPITAARGIFDPEIDLDDVGTVNITSLPDFLTEEEVVADIDNPQIWLTLTSTMPLGGTIKAKLTSDTHPSPILLDDIQVAASQDGINPALTRVVICRQQPEGLTGYTPMIVPNLSELIEKLKEPMQIKFTVIEAKASQETATIQLGQNYTLAPKYRFECPLAFGNKAVIVYSDKENDWNKDIDKLNLANGAYVHMTGTAISKIPADMELILNPIDVNGNKLSAVTVDLIKKDVAGTKDAPKESPIEAKISGNISKLDGVELKLKAKSNEALRGVTLNKTTQTLKLNDLKVKLVGKVIYDAN
jgi:hypothetical protein